MSANPQVDRRALTHALAAVKWPAHYLDFETTKTCVPLYPDVAPHEQIPTQYSLHVCSRPGQVVRHHEFLADPRRDCRCELAQQLIRDLGEEGSIIVYSSFEKTTLSGLAKRFRDLGAPLRRCIDRLIDFEPLFPSHFVHPGFRGRTSLKVVLPVLVDMDYAGLRIGDGDTAVAMFARLARGEFGAEEAAEIEAALRTYCRQDTLAMVKLHEALHRIT